jgi:NADPH:quinone reductase-like Zn-dependent oxidoreductase
MRAWQLSREGLAHLTITDRPDPGDGDVVVRMKAASLNYRDWMIANGPYRLAVRYPIVPLSDGAGEIMAVGRRVTKWRPGDQSSPGLVPLRPSRYGERAGDASCRGELLKDRLLARNRNVTEVTP